MKEIIQNEEHRLQSMDGESEPQSAWILTGSYVKLDVKGRNGARPLIGKEARKTLVIRIASHFCQSINPQIIEADSSKQFGGGGITWAITESELHILIEQLWQTVKKENSLSTVPKFACNEVFPYRNSKGMVLNFSSIAELMM